MPKVTELGGDGARIQILVLWFWSTRTGLPWPPLLRPEPRPHRLEEQPGGSLPQLCPPTPTASPWRPAPQAAFIDSGFSFRRLKADKEREC